MLRRTNRFHGYNSLSFVYRKGSTVRVEDMSLRYHINSKRTTYRAAVVVGRKVHKSAVVRNRIRRRVFEQLRLQLQTLDQAYDIVVTVHTDKVATMPATELAEHISQLLRQASIINSKT